MPKVQHRKARKDYLEHGIAKGDMYYFAQMKTGPRSSRTIRSKTPIPASQLTTSAFIGGWLAQAELAKETTLTPETIREIAGTIRELGDEARERFENMPEGLQMSENGTRLEERAEKAEEVAGELEDKADEIDNLLGEITDLLGDTPD